MSLRGWLEAEEDAEEEEESGPSGPFFLDELDDDEDVELSAHVSDSGHNWAKHAASGSGTLVFTDANRVRLGVTNSCFYRSDVEPPSADYIVETLIRCFSTAVINHKGPVARMVAGATQTFIHCRINAEDNIYQLYQFINGAATLLNTAPFNPVIGEEYLVGLEVEGNIARVYADGEMVIEEEITVLDAGSIGFRLAANFGEANDTGFHLARMEAREL